MVEIVTTWWDRWKESVVRMRYVRKMYVHQNFELEILFINNARRITVDSRVLPPHIRNNFTNEQIMTFIEHD